MIPNHNYAAFVGSAVTSALALDWPRVEVVVVDDGSTDHSLDVLAGFGDRIRLLRQENAGPRAACNRGFAATRGDAVLFLDSDDEVDPALARRVADVWRPGVSKVQVQMTRIDRHGRTVGRPFPNYRSTPTPAQVRRWMAATSSYPTPPGSGNVYAREFLDRLFPLDGRCGDATDSACLAAAPFLGDVVTVPEPLVRYRLHGDNRSDLLADTRRFTRQIERAVQRQRLAADLLDDRPPGAPGAPDPTGEAERLMRPLRRGRHLLQMRVAERRLHPGAPPLPGDGRRRLAHDTVAALAAPGPESVPHRLAVAAWCLVVLTAPGPLARRLVSWRFAPPRT